MSGKGNAGIRGGYWRDLLINIEEVPHPELKEDTNVVYNLYLNFADAALGTRAEVPTIGGSAKIKIQKERKAESYSDFKEKEYQA